MNLPESKTRTFFRSLGYACIIMFFAFLINALVPVAGINAEAAGFLYNYSLPRPLLESVFDPLINDWGLYQCRELSYLIDKMDASFIMKSWVNGFYHLFSISAFLFLFLTVWSQLYYAGRLFPEMGKLLPVLCSSGYAFHYACSSFIFFRSSKHACAFFTTMVIFMTISLIRRRFQMRKHEIVLIPLFLLIAALFDRLGVFLTGSYLVLLGVYAVCSGIGMIRPAAKHGFPVIAGIGSGVFLLEILLNVLIVPVIVHCLNGYYPLMLYQQKMPAPGLNTLFDGMKFFFANAGRTFTMLSEPGYAAAAGALILLLMLLLFIRKAPHDFLWIAFGVSLSAMLACSCGMVLRHPALVSLPDVMYSGYFKIFIAALFPFFLFALKFLNRKIAILLVFSVLGLTVILPYFSRPFLSGSEESPLIRALNDPAYDTRTLAIPYRERLLIERVHFLRTGRKPAHDLPGNAPQ